MKPKQITPSKVKWQLILALSLTSILLIVGAYQYYISEKDRIMRDKINDLTAITDLKVKEIVQWHKERKSEAEFFSSGSTFINYTKALLLNKNEIQPKKYLTQSLGHIKSSHSYENIFISSQLGEILFSLDNTFNQIDSITKQYIQEAILQKKIFFRDLFYCNEHKRIHYDLVAPIIDENNNSIAAMVMRINPDDYLYPLIQSWPLPSETAEVLIFRKEKDHVLFLNALRHKKNTALLEKIPLTNKDVVSVIAVSGIQGIIEGKDYRNIDVIADVYPVPDTPWFLASKIDNSEVFSELGSKAILISLIVIISILFIGTGITLAYSNRKINLYKKMFLTEGALRTSENKLRQAEGNIRKLSRGVEQSPAAIIITDINGNIEYTNPKFTEVTGFTFDEVKGKNPRILKSGDKPIEEYQNMWKTLLDKKEWRGEFQNKRKNGELYWELASISPIVNERGEITNFIAVKENITEWKQMTNELIIAKEKAEEMNRVKSYFYANVSHELRTPFIGIIGFAELLADRLHKQEEKEMAEIILKSSKRLIDTLNKILSIAKLEFDKPEIQISRVDVQEILKNLQVLFSKSAEMRNTTIRTEFNSKQFLFRTDEILLHEILTNLINNAVKYTSNGLIEISIEIITKNKEEFLVIKVADTGIGIPKEKQEIIWHEFRQVSEGFSRSFEGTGLGLSIVKKYTELLGGNIFLESEVGKGSTFTVELPMIVSPDKIDEIDIAEVQENSRDKEILDENKTKGKTILLVEDDQISADYIQRILSENYKLDIVESADKALEKIGTNLYSALLIDINLGYGIDGVELMQLIREKPGYKKIPMVAVTAYASANDKEEFLGKGFSHYISKPFASNEITNLLIKVFNGIS